MIKQNNIPKIRFIKGKNKNTHEKNIDYYMFINGKKSKYVIWYWYFTDEEEKYQPIFLSKNKNKETNSIHISSNFTNLYNAKIICIEHYMKNLEEKSLDKSY